MIDNQIIKVYINQTFLTSLFSTNIWLYQGTKGQGWRAIPTEYRKASDILTSTLATFLFSSHPKRERVREDHLNYFTPTVNNWERQLHTARHQVCYTRGKTICFLPLALLMVPSDASEVVPPMALLLFWLFLVAIYPQHVVNPIRAVSYTHLTLPTILRV